MGLNITVQNVGYDKQSHTATIVADTVATERPSGTFALNSGNPFLAKKWNGIFGNDASSLRGQLFVALDAVRRHNADHRATGKKSILPLPGGEIRAYSVREGVFASVTYLYNGPDNICDGAVVRLLDGARILTFNISIENGLSTFVAKAIDYVNRQESTPAEKQNAVAAK